jgi:hypothetical protein
MMEKYESIQPKTLNQALFLSCFLEIYLSWGKGTCSVIRRRLNNNMICNHEIPIISLLFK